MAAESFLEQNMTTSDDRSTRIVEATAAVLAGTTHRQLGITALNKTLFYLDLSSLLETGHTVSGAVYRALPQGPVVADYKRRLVRVVVDAGVAVQQNADGTSGPDPTERPLVLLRLPPFALLSEEDRERAAKAGAWAQGRTARWLSDYSHKNPGWRLAYDAGQALGRPACAIDMMVALQQLADEDPWMGEAADEELESAFASATEESGRPWQ